MRALTFFLLVVIFNSSYSQSEFKEYENGLIYSPHAMKRLTTIIGEKNEDFRKCDLSKNFMSLPQSTGYYFEVDAEHNKEISKDLKSNITLEEFLKKYSQKKEQKLLLSKHEYERYDNKIYIELNLLPKERSFTILKDDWKNSKFGNWIAKFDGKEEIQILYLNTPLKEIELPFELARMIQYSECLVDTTSTIKLNIPLTGNSDRRGDLLKIQRFTDFVSKSFGEKFPEYPFKGDDWDEKKYEIFASEVVNYELRLDAFVEEKLSKTEKFQSKLQDIYEEVSKSGNSTDVFEEYVSKYISKKSALQLKRNREVIGNCSQDDSPRIHALNIAQLSAESFTWEIFLRAHLNIMNDRFSRVSDGSYAYAKRNTYIKELEELNISVNDLLLGITFRVSNPSKNHYFGSIGRLGRAIAESKNVKVFKTQISEIIANENLDDYNRVLAFYLYSNLQFYEDKNSEKEFNKETVLKAKELLPLYLHDIEI